MKENKKNKAQAEKLREKLRGSIKERLSGNKAYTAPTPDAGAGESGASPPWDHLEPVSAAQTSPQTSAQTSLGQTPSDAGASHAHSPEPSREVPAEAPSARAAKKGEETDFFQDLEEHAIAEMDRMKSTTLFSGSADSSSSTPFGAAPAPEPELPPEREPVLPPGARAPRSLGPTRSTPPAFSADGAPESETFRPEPLAQPSDTRLNSTKGDTMSNKKNQESINLKDILSQKPKSDQKSTLKAPTGRNPKAIEEENRRNEEDTRRNEADEAHEKEVAAGPKTHDQEIFEALRHKDSAFLRAKAVPANVPVERHEIYLSLVCSAPGDPEMLGALLDAGFTASETGNAVKSVFSREAWNLVDQFEKRKIGPKLDTQSLRKLWAWRRENIQTSAQNAENASSAPGAAPAGLDVDDELSNFLEQQANTPAPAEAPAPAPAAEQKEEAEEPRDNRSSRRKEKEKEESRRSQERAAAEADETPAQTEEEEPVVERPARPSRPLPSARAASNPKPSSSAASSGTSGSSPMERARQKAIDNLTHEKENLERELAEWKEAAEAVEAEKNELAESLEQTQADLESAQDAHARLDEAQKTLEQITEERAQEETRWAKELEKTQDDLRKTKAALREQQERFSQSLEENKELSAEIETLNNALQEAKDALALSEPVDRFTQDSDMEESFAAIAFCAACAKGDLPKAQKIMSQDDTLTREQVSAGLVFAAQNGHSKLLSWLVHSAGANPQWLSNLALQRSLQFSQMDTFFELVALGANPHAYEEFALRHLARENESVMIERLVLRHGASPSAADSSALRQAASANAVDAFRTLLFLGANPWNDEGSPWPEITDKDLMALVDRREEDKQKLSEIDPDFLRLSARQPS